MQVICKYYDIVGKGLEHLWILLIMGMVLEPWSLGYHGTTMCIHTYVCMHACTHTHNSCWFCFFGAPSLIQRFGTLPVFKCLDRKLEALEAAEKNLTQPCWPGSCLLLLERLSPSGSCSQWYPLSDFPSWLVPGPLPPRRQIVLVPSWVRDYRPHDKSVSLLCTLVICSEAHLHVPAPSDPCLPKLLASGVCQLS